MVLDGTGWYWMVLDGTGWYWFNGWEPTQMVRSSVQICSDHIEPVVKR